MSGRQGEHWLLSPRILRPVEKSTDFETEKQRDFQKSLCPWTANMSKDVLRIGCCPRRILGCGYHPQAEKDGRLPQKPHTLSESPRTLQPQAESVIDRGRRTIYFVSGHARRRAQPGDVRSIGAGRVPLPSPCGLHSGGGERNPLVEAV